MPACYYTDKSAFVTCMKRPRSHTYKLARRIVIAIFGFTVLLIGIVMVVAPGPALVVIPLGLGILGLEFAWARLWLRKIKRKVREQTERWRPHKQEDKTLPPS